MLQLTIEKCSRHEVEVLSEVLEGRGALSVTYMDRMDTPILEPELGTTPLWDDVIIHALYESDENIQEIRALLTEKYPHLLFECEEVQEQDWERVCVADLKPLQFGKRLWVCPSWHTPPDKDAINVQLDPGLAFGTGMHPTTRLCLTWLESADLKLKKLIDYGCGSGILALAAIKLGASHVDAVDLDEQALIATRQNAKANHLSTVELSVSSPDILIEPVDIIIANILLTPLLALKNEFIRLLLPGGKIVISGILDYQEAQLIAAYQDKFHHHATMREDEWRAVVFTI